MSEYWKGIALPWGTTIPSVIEPKSDKYILRSSVLWIVLTELGERVMNPEFGVNLREFLHEPADVSTVTLLKSAVKDAIRRWDPRVQFLDLKAQAKDNTINVSIEFSDRADPTQETIVAEFQLSSKSIGLE